MTNSDELVIVLDQDGNIVTATEKGERVPQLEGAWLVGVKGPEPLSHPAQLPYSAVQVACKWKKNPITGQWE